MPGDELRFLTRRRATVSLLLRVGLMLAVVLMASGVALYVASGSRVAPALALTGLFAGDAPISEWLMELGIIVLGLTPAAAVVALIVLWARGRNLLFAGVGVVVLALLATAALVGR